VYEELFENPKSSILNETNPYMVILKEGEMLYIPAQWFHFIEHVDALNLNLTYWFGSSKVPQKVGRSTRDVLRVCKLLSAFVLAKVISLVIRCTGMKHGILP
jgi:hypothetical protein